MLARQLDVPHYVAVGILECLWHLCARETPAGDIGKLSNLEIALGIDWRGDPDDLVNVLTERGWIDRCDDSRRLILHDWLEHCDNTVKKALQRKGLAIASKRVEKCLEMSGNVQTTADKNALPLPLPLPEPEPKSVCAETSSAPASDPVTLDERSEPVWLPTRSQQRWPVPLADCRNWERAYPRVNVRLELWRMRLWLEANPLRGKTARGMKAFVVRWLKRAQSEPTEFRSRGQPYDPGLRHKEPDPTPEEVERVRTAFLEAARKRKASGHWKTVGDAHRDLLRLAGEWNEEDEERWKAAHNST